MKIKIVALALSIFLLIRCGTKDEVVQVLGPEGQVQEEYTIDQDSLRHGTYTQYYASGDTFEFAHYNHGKLDGIRKLYYEGNKLEILEVYERDTLQGMYRAYYESGQLKREMNFIDNAIQGTLKVYYEDGQIKEEVNMRDNLEEGPFIEYYPNGQKAWEGNYENGENEIGLLVHFAENGDTIRKMMCDERYICRTFYFNEAYEGKEQKDN